MEFPHLERLVAKYGPKGFVVVTVNTMPGSDADGAAFMSMKGYHFTHLTAPSDEWAQNMYGFQAAPTTVLLDRQGREILRHVGFGLASVRAMDDTIGAVLKR